MSQDRLGAAMMPLGDFTKSTTRQMAADLDLAVANKPESQDICFVPFKRYTEFIELYAPRSAARPNRRWPGAGPG